MVEIGDIININCFNILESKKFYIMFYCTSIRNIKNYRCAVLLCASGSEHVCKFHYNYINPRGSTLIYDQFISAICESQISDWIYDDELKQYIYMGDINISIKRGNDEMKFKEDWTSNYDNSEAYMVKFYLCYFGNKIETFYTAAVDDTKCFLPYPNLNKMSITSRQYLIGKIINESVGNNSYDGYIHKAGIKVSEWVRFN